MATAYGRFPSTQNTVSVSLAGSWVNSFVEAYISEACFLVEIDGLLLGVPARGW